MNETCSIHECEMDGEYCPECEGEKLTYENVGVSPTEEAP